MCQKVLGGQRRKRDNGIMGIKPCIHYREKKGKYDYVKGKDEQKN